MLPEHNSEHVHHLSAILKQIVSKAAKKEELKALSYGQKRHEGANGSHGSAC